MLGGSHSRPEFGGEHDFSFHGDVGNDPFPLVVEDEGLFDESGGQLLERSSIRPRGLRHSAEFLDGMLDHPVESFPEQVSYALLLLQRPLALVLDRPNAKVG